MKIPPHINPDKDYYAVLGVDKSADIKDIRKTRKELLTKYHPDRKKGDEDKYKEISEAGDVLCNKKNKIIYDAIRSGNIKEVKGEEDEWKFRADIFKTTVKDVVYNTLLFIQNKFMEKVPEEILDSMPDTIDFIREIMDEKAQYYRHNFAGFTIHQEKEEED